MFATILAHTTVYATIMGFVLTVVDRICAKFTKKPFRIHVNILFVIACLLGAAGVMLGMFFAPRDLYKPEVRLGVPAIALGEIVLMFWAVPGYWDAIKGVFGG